MALHACIVEIPGENRKLAVACVKCGRCLAPLSFNKPWPMAGGPSDA